jgi:hypothetical protein
MGTSTHLMNETISAFPPSGPVVESCDVGDLENVRE